MQGYWGSTAIFQSTLLMRGATRAVRSTSWQPSHFNPRSSCEERHARYRSFHPADAHFNPRSSCEERPQYSRSEYPRSDFNPRSSCEERHSAGYAFGAVLTHFNPRSSCEERLLNLDLFEIVKVFQSTLLMRGATFRLLVEAHEARHFNPRSSCEERRLHPVLVPSAMDFNPRSSCEERHIHLGDDYSQRDDFNPRSSCEERRDREADHRQRLLISIHAPHARSDLGDMVVQPGQRDFNPRSSCEERRPRRPRRHVDKDFNPRSSCEERRA